MLIAFCGLPGTGKTTLARSLARRLPATYLRIDTIEDVLLADDGAAFVGRGAGYCVAYAVAEDNLALGQTVVADSGYPIKITREAWRNVAKRAGVTMIEVLVTCSDSAQHRGRVEARPPGARASNWMEILSREFDAVDSNAVVVDTADRSVEQCLAELEIALQDRMK